MLSSKERDRIRYLSGLIGKITTPPWRWGCWDTIFGLLEPEDIRERRTLEHAPSLPGDGPAIRTGKEQWCRSVLRVGDPIENKHDSELICIAPDAIADLIGMVLRLDNELPESGDFCMIDTKGQKEELATLDDLLSNTRQGGAFNIYLLKVNEFVEDAGQGCQLSLDELKTLYSRGWHPKRAARLCDGKTTEHG